MDYRAVQLENLNSGAIIDLFKEEFQKVLDNIADDNTDPTKPREIKIQVTVKPSKDRAKADTKVRVTSSLAPLKPHESFILLSFDGKKTSAFVTDINQPELTAPDGGKITEFPAVKGGN